MSSFWSFLCFPRRRTLGGKSHGRHRHRRKNNVVTLQRRKLLEESDSQTQPTQNSNEHTTVENERLNDGTQNIVYGDTQNSVPNKRRRIQDIFNMDDNSAPEVHSGNFSNSKVPNLFYRDKPKRANCRNVDSMYGYVPKAMQHLYTSTALEGQKIEDYFSNLHNDIYFSKFANSETVEKDKTGCVLKRFSFTRVPSTASSIKDEEKVSLMEDDGVNEMDIQNFNDFEQWQGDVEPKTKYNMEDSFHSMLNSTEEVLY